MNSKSKQLVVAILLATAMVMTMASMAFAQGPVTPVQPMPEDALAWGRGPGGAGSTWQANGRRGGAGGGAVGSLTDAEVDALYMVLDDEYHAWAVYDQVITDFGEVSPFVEIRAAEAKHAAAVVRQLERYGLEVPENEWIGNVPSFDSVAEACAAAAQAEIDNAGLYDTALAATDKTNLIRVFTNLQSASLNSHLPAFEACTAS